MSEQYFSRISLKAGSSSSPAFWQTFRDPYALHRSIWGLFSDGPERKRDFLYRVMDAQKPPVIYAVSARPPVLEQALWAAEVKEYRPRVQAGTRLEFSLRANPVVTREGKRHDVVMDAKRVGRPAGASVGEMRLEAEIMQDAGCGWLTKRAELYGFRLETVRADGYRQHSFLKRKQQNSLRFSTLDFFGVLEVLDLEKFRTTLFDGMGHAKGFGCGMLMVKRAG